MSDKLSSPNTDLLFVYGTLMQGNHNEFATRLHQNSSYLGKGYFPGCLYQIDWFPGAIYDSSAPTRVWGEVYRLFQPDVMLSNLDGYEGIGDEPPLYERVVIPVYLYDLPVFCHTYLYCLPTVHLALIESGIFNSVR